MLSNNLQKHINLNFKIKVIDNFLCKSDFRKLINLPINKKIKYGFTSKWGSINKYGVINGNIDHKVIKALHNNYHYKALKILKELCKAKLDLYEFSEFSLIVTAKDSISHIHDDIPNKLLSGVVYLSPKINYGTFFYNNKNSKKNKIEVMWKVNRAVFFSRKERKTWHSYQGDGNNNRLVLVYNLMTTKVREVYKIEKKFFFIYYTLIFFKENFYVILSIVKKLLRLS